MSVGFGDVYFSRHGGIAETEHVFLHGNDLPARFAEGFTIGELGFGTGLNFLVAWRAFQQAMPDATLHYMAIEKFPLTLEMLRATLALQPALAPWAEALLAAYPLRLPGVHRLVLPGVRLTLCFGDVEEMLPEWTRPVHAWFLDGFAPAKNADMWKETVLGHIGRLSQTGTQLATFTAASAVRRGLQAVGFEIRKVPGFGRKRDMLVGWFASDGGDPAISPCGSARPAVSPPMAAPWGVRTDAIILGAGIAGATAARALAERGMAVAVLERGTVAQGGSGNPAGVLFPQLTKRWTPSAAWYFTAYGFALRQLARWRQEGLEFAGEAIGMLRLPRHEAEALQLQKLQENLGLDTRIVRWLDAEAASSVAGMKLMTGAAFFPHGTWLSPRDLCHALLQHRDIKLHTRTAAKKLHYAEGLWHVQTECGRSFAAKELIIATAESAAFLEGHGIRLNHVAGQVSIFPAAQAASPMRCILCHKGYVVPHGDQVLVGATYNHDDAVGVVTPENHAANAAELAQFLPGWMQGKAVAGRASLRATTPDRLPYVGMLEAGLWVSVGHGSRGLLSAPLAAEMIASAMCGESSPVARALAHTVRATRAQKPL